MAACAMISAVAACSSKPVVKPRIPLTENECSARGGQWVHNTIVLSSAFCSIATTDAGKRCSDSSECQGTCNAVLAYGSTSFRGECSSVLVSQGGCPKFVERGKLVQEPCI